MDKIKDKLSEIEKLLLEINFKIDNFLGFEELTDEEKRELDLLKKEIKNKKFDTFKTVFKD